MIRVAAWRGGAPGIPLFNVDDPIIEHDWLPALGPTTFQIARRLYDALTAAGGEFGIAVDVAALAATLGVKPNVAERSIGRLVQFGRAEWRNGILSFRVQWVARDAARDLPPWWKAEAPCP